MKGNKNVDLAVKGKRVTLEIKGYNDQRFSDIRKFGHTVCELLEKVGQSGVYKVEATKFRLNSSNSLKGISLAGMVHETIIAFGYQPGSNDSRRKYLLTTGMSPEECNNLYANLKCFMDGSTVAVKEASQKTQASIELSEETSAIATTEAKAPKVAFVKPVSKPKVYYTNDQDFIDGLLIELLDRAAKQDKGLLTKDQVLDTIVDMTHFNNRFGIGPISMHLEKKGYVKEFSDGLFEIVADPPLVPIRKKKVSKANSQTKTPTSSGASKSYINDPDWMHKCMTGLKRLVDEKGGILTRAQVSDFVKLQLQKGASARALSPLLKGLEIRGYIISAGKAGYRVRYEPSEKLVKAAEAEAVKEKEEQKSLFSTFTPVHMPNFAAGTFANPVLLRTMLTSLREQGVITSKFLKSLIVSVWKVSPTAQEHMIRFLVVKGYLVRLKPGVYELGPTSRRILGLPEKQYRNATAPAVKANDSSPVVSEPDESKQADAGEVSGMLSEDEVEKLPFFARDVFDSPSDLRNLLEMFPEQGDMKSMSIKEILAARFSVGDSSIEALHRKMRDFGYIAQTSFGMYKRGPMAEKLFGLVAKATETQKRAEEKPTSPPKQLVVDNEFSNTGALVPVATPESNQALAKAYLERKVLEAELAEALEEAAELRSQLSNFDAAVDAAVQQKLLVLLSD